MRIILLALLLVNFSLFGQEDITELVHTSKNGSPIINGYAVKHSEEKGLCIFIHDSQTIAGNAFDEDFIYLGRLDSKPITRTQEYISGKSFDDSYSVFIKDDEKPNLQVLTYDFENQVVSETELAINVSKKDILMSFDHKGLFYLLCIDKIKDELSIYNVDKYYEVSEKRFDLEKFDFFDAGDKARSLTNLLHFYKDEITKIYAKSIQEEFPISLPESTNKIKLYQDGSKIYITLDVSNNRTQLVQLDFLSDEVSINNYVQASGNKEHKIQASNSFIFEQYLLQIVAYKKDFSIAVKELSNKEKIASYTWDGSDAIAFTNTGTLKLKPSKNKRKEVSGKKFNSGLRKKPLGIYAYRKFENLQISFGFWDKAITLEEQKTRNVLMTSMAVPFGASGVLFAFVVSPKGSVRSYGLHHNGTTTRAIGVFDAEFKHLPNVGVMPTVFHKIDRYVNRHEGTLPMLLFKYEDYFIYGSFYPEQNALKLLKF